MYENKIKYFDYETFVKICEIFHLFFKEFNAMRREQKKDQTQSILFKDNSENTELILNTFYVFSENVPVNKEISLCYHRERI